MKGLIIFFAVSFILVFPYFFKACRSLGELFAEMITVAVRAWVEAWRDVFEYLGVKFKK